MTVLQFDNVKIPADLSEKDLTEKVTYKCTFPKLFHYIVYILIIVFLNANKATQ